MTEARLRSAFQWLVGVSCVHHWWPCDWCRATQRYGKGVGR